MNRTTISALWAAALIIVSQGALAGDDPKVAAEVMAITRAQWAAEAQGKSIAEQNAALADDYTEFNGDYPVRIDGKAANVALYEATARSGEKSVLGEMMNPKVQVYGDVAILTYNYVGVTQAKDGKTTSSKAKSTRVYAKVGGAWKLVHANFAPVAAPAN
jgi:ketosteroid isomerase-like protein